MVGPEKVLEFWLDKIGPEGWYVADEAVDAQIREEFMPNSPAICSAMTGVRFRWTLSRSRRPNRRFAKAGISRSMRLHGSSSICR